MTSSPTFQNLCCELIEEYYGDFYRAIFESLASMGRLTAPQVAQKCHLPLRQAKAGICSLIQLRLVKYHSVKEAPTIYSANLSRAYNTIRTGRLIQAARERSGDAAAEILSIVCQLGFATVGEVRDRLLHDAQLTSHLDTKEIEQTIQVLIDNHFLIMLRKAHFHEAHDAKRDIELSIMSPAALARLTGTKAKLEHAEAIETKYRQAVDTGYPEYGQINANFASHLGGQYANGGDEATTNGHSVQLSTLVQPNYHKVVTSSQIACAQECATRNHNKMTSAVISCIVRQVANPDVWSKSGSYQSSQLDMRQLQRDITTELQWQSPAELPNGMSRLNGFETHDSQEHDLVHIGDVERELMLLEEGVFKFLSRIGCSWTISKDSLDLWIKQEEVLRVIESRLDAPAPRILRIVIDKGMLEEKTLQEVGLLGAKELRQSLSKLKQMGYLDLQEIPRDPHRLPNKTVFLWNHDVGRVANLVIENVYTSILRMVQLLKIERKSLAGTLEKVEREDVKGKEQEMLAPGEFTVLERFRRLEQWIWCEIHRLDSTIAILRDL